MELNMDIVGPITCGESRDMAPMVVSAREETCRSTDKDMASALSQQHRVGASCAERGGRHDEAANPQDSRLDQLLKTYQWVHAANGPTVRRPASHLAGARGRRLR